ncbi:MAG: STAS/SEC14 domain-containing protein [Acidimicrobiia bacterium]|nr:STAS/SEC14 domain-containing protein [Acidimicrobiia bacterium]
MDLRTTATGQIWLDGEGIVHFVATGAASTADTAAENQAVLEELTAGGRTAILFDVRSWPSGSPSFWVRFINAIEHICLAGAVLVDPQSQDNLGTFPSLISSLLVPFQVFPDEDEALAFLRNHRPA